MIYVMINPLLDMGRLLPMMAAHSEEIYGADGNFDANHLYAIINAGMARVYAVQTDEGAYAGYTIFILSRDIFQAHIKQAECIALYMKPEYRNLTSANKLMRFAENTLAHKDKVSRIISTTSNSKGLQSFYKRLGYTVSNVQVVKEL